MSKHTDTLQQGDKIGSYRIEEVLGRGGFAVTYLAIDENLDVEVAIKEYLPREITQRDANNHVSARKPDFAEDYDVGLKNFAREAKTLARFKHPHIVRVHQVLHENNTAYMVMEFEHGQELAEIMEQQQTLPEDELRSILFPILDGVEEIHRHGFVHRDIKPSNIYVRQNGSPVLIDFGAARYTMTEATQQLTAVVTVGYTPIEQYNVSEDAQGPWSDIYALAAVCYEAVTGEVPTDSVTRASASVTNGNDPLSTVRSLATQGYSDDCLDAIDWGLRMEAEDRPQVIAQWRDSFDGIFNPASAYVVQKDVSIYSPHRVDTPRKAQNQNESRLEKPASDHNPDYDDVVSIPLRPTETPLDSDVMSLDAGTRRDSAITTMPDLDPHADDSRSGYGRDSHSPASAERGNGRQSQHPDQQPGNNRGAQDGTARNDLRKDQSPPVTNIYQNSTNGTASSGTAKKRSKLERPSHLDTERPAARQRTLRDEIEFDDSDWNYEPPQKSSAWKLLFPALGLAAVVGASVLYVNFPELVRSIGGKGSELTAAQALELAEDKYAASDFIFPPGASAFDYYQQALLDDPENAQAKAGIRSIESAVRRQISENMDENNLSEANRLLARADDAGLTGLYATEDKVVLNDTSQNTDQNTADTSPVVTPSEDTIITPVNTASIQPTAIDNTVAAITNAEAQEQARTTSVSAQPSTGIDNNVSPFIQQKIKDIEKLIDDKRFTEARALYQETDQFIPDQVESRRLIRAIDTGEADEALAAAQAQLEAEQRRAEAEAKAAADALAEAEAKAAADALAEAEATAAAAAAATAAANSSSTTGSTANNAATIAARPANEPPRNSYVDGTGPGADHLDQLRLALEAKDIDAVRSISQDLPEGRIRFLNSTFARHHRLDVIIDEVTSNGNSITGRLNVAMFGRADDGSIYGAGKWNGALISATRQNGTWQKIRW